MVFLWFSYGFSVFLWFFGFPMVNPPFSSEPSQDGASLDLGLLDAAATDPTAPLEVVECHSLASDALLWRSTDGESHRFFLA